MKNSDYLKSCDIRSCFYDGTQKYSTNWYKKKKETGMMLKLTDNFVHNTLQEEVLRYRLVQSKWIHEKMIMDRVDSVYVYSRKMI